MARGKFAWERDPTFEGKREQLRRSILPTRTGLLLLAISVVYLLLVFFIAPLIIHRGPLDIVSLIVLIAIFAGVAILGARLLGITGFELPEPTAEEPSKEEAATAREERPK